jgi:hypothetical protein
MTGWGSAERIVLTAILVGLTACASPTTSPLPSPTRPAASAVGSASGWFGEVPGWEFVDAPAAGQDFDDLANRAVAGLGAVQVQAAAEATPVGACCSANVIGFTIAPGPGHTESELVVAIVDAIRGAGGADPGPACNEQAVSVIKGSREVVLGPWAGGRSPFLVADGPAIGSARTIYSLLIGAGPTGCD